MNNTNTSPRRSGLLGIVLGVIMLAVALVIAAGLFIVLYLIPARVERSDLPSQQPALVQAASPAEFAERNGIEVLMLGVTAEGGLIDMRFRVTDPEKAALLLDEAHRPRLIAEDSGTVLTRHIRPEYKALEGERVYYLLYANAQNAIRPGSLVTVELDGLRVEHLIAR